MALLKAPPWWLYVGMAWVAAMLLYGASQRSLGASKVTTAVTATQVLVKDQHTALKARTERAQVAATTKVSTDYETQLATLRSRYDAYRRLHPATAAPGPSSGSHLPTLPNAPGEPDAAPSGQGLPVFDAVAELAQAADENTAKLLSLQEWVREQQRVDLCATLDPTMRSPQNTSNCSKNETSGKPD